MKDNINAFVPHNIAQKLRDAGFDEPCMSFYWKDGELAGYCAKNVSAGYTLEDMSQSSISDCLAPTYEQVCEWLRKKHHTHIQVEYSWKLGSMDTSYFPRLIKISGQGKGGGEKIFEYYDEYVLAQQKGIEEVLNRI